MTDLDPAVFILPHCDDEVFAFPIFSRINKEAARFIFITSNEIREKETRQFLQSMGFTKPEQIYFLQNHLAVQDGNVFKHLPALFSALDELISEASCKALFTVAYEGGHHDHDACAVMCNFLAKKRGFALYTYALYNARRTRFFRVMNDDGIEATENPQAIRLHLNLKEAFGFLRSLFFYGSQRKTFLGLLPGILHTCFIKRVITFRKIEQISLEIRPHAGPLFYEKRFKVTFADTKASFKSLDAHLKTL